MYPLVESIRIENKQFHHVDLHNQRINNARQIIYGLHEPVDIETIVQIPDSLTDDRYKCRLNFFTDRIDYTITPYIQREIRSLKVVADNSIDYTFKSENRIQLDAALELRGNCDDIIIVKNGHITDAWAANIILFDGTSWFTPDTPLLKGIQREYLLSEGVIVACEITIDHLFEYKKIKLINAMIDFERAPEIIVSENIYF
jgi:4-amino-4-deoxychorismate lyase